MEQLGHATPDQVYAAVRTKSQSINLSTVYRTLEMVLAHNTGFVETWYGEIHADQPRFEITTDAVVRTATAKEYAGGKRLYGYVNGDLLYAFDMAAMGQELQPHTHAQLKRH